MRNCLWLCGFLLWTSALAQPALTERGENPKAAKEVWEGQPIVRPFAFIRTGYFYLFGHDGEALVGSRSGFRLVNLRVGVAVRPFMDLQTVASVDGASIQADPLQPLNGVLFVQLRDAYVEYDALRFAQIRAGQFKAPYSAETLMSDFAVPFFTRSIVNQGIAPPDGFPVPGLTLDRQLGVQISSARIGDVVHFRYLAALVNGNGQNMAFNDNGSVAPVGRIEIGAGDWLTLGVDGFYNRRTVGNRPNRLSEDRVGFGADLFLRLGGASLLVELLGRSTRPLTTGLPVEHALGVVAQLYYWHVESGLEFGARYAAYEPSNRVADDQISAVDLLLGYRFQKFPARLVGQYTHRVEAASTAVDNDGLTLFTQVMF